MTTPQNDQWIRKLGLIVFNDDQGLDLSEFHVKFSIQNADVESPNSAAIRVYNLSADTVRRLTGNTSSISRNQGEFTRVVLNAGYVNGNYGVVFQGTIKQFRIGRENNTTSYVDILAADGDVAYNQGVVNFSMAAGTTPARMVEEVVKNMPGAGLDIGNLTIDKQHVPNIRGTVMFGMARARMRNLASSLDASWSIQDGKVTLLDNTGYAEGEAVAINIGTGLIGLPEQTDGGIRLQCLLNSRIRIGGLVQLNNSEIIQLWQSDPNAAPIPYNQWTGVQPLAALSPDGYYRAFVVEHEGDTRGNTWYTNLVCLAVDISAPRNRSVAENG